MSIFFGIWTHSSRGVVPVGHDLGPSHVGAGGSFGRSLRIQMRDLSEQQSWHRDFGHLECDVAGMGHDLRTDLDEFFLEARQPRPLHGERLKENFYLRAFPELGITCRGTGTSARCKDRVECVTEVVTAEVERLKHQGLAGDRSAYFSDRINRFTSSLPRH